MDPREEKDATAAVEDEEKEWGEWEEDDDESTAASPCPFCAVAIGGGATAVLGHCTSAHGVDLAAIRRDWHLGDYGWIRLVNWIRALPDHSASLSWSSLGVTSRNHPLFTDDRLLIPVLPNDPLLFIGGEDDDEVSGEGETKESGAIADPPKESSSSSAAAAEIAMLREENERLREAARRILEDGDDAKADSCGSSSDESSDGEVDGKCSKSAAAARSNVEDDPYFNSYARMGIHEEMLRDKARTGAYEAWARTAGQAGLLRGKTVMDVGAGTGILSILAAREGAERVFAVEASSTAEIARRVIAANGVADKVTVVHSSVETAVLPKGTKVDVIVSEWMGYFLLFENMLESVLFARDQWLAPGGSVQPSHAMIYVSALECPEIYSDRKDFFQGRPYGVDLRQAMPSAFSEVSVEIIEPHFIAAGPARICEIDTATVPRGHLANVTYPFELTLARDVDAIHCMCSHFDVDFRMPGAETVTLTTAADAVPTHWKQCVMYLDDPVPACPAGTRIAGSLRFVAATAGPHDLDVQLDMRVTLPGADPSAAPLFAVSKKFHV